MNTRRVASIVGAIGFVLVLIGMLARSRDAYFAWLTALLFSLSLALGALLFILIQHAMSGTWFVLFRRIAEATTFTLVIIAVLFIPLVFDLRQVFPWAETASSVELAGGKRTWLSIPFFLIRATAYFAVWVTVSSLLSRWSLRQADGDAIQLAQRQRIFSAGMLPVVGFTASFAAFDWIMSLDPRYYSTIFGLYFLAGSVLGFLSLLAPVSYLLMRRGLLQDLTVSHIHALGKLLLVFVVFWAYIAYCQYFLTWIADIPDEAHWYYNRSRGSWAGVSLLLAVGKFGLPFFALLSRRLKRSARALAVLGAGLVVMQYVDVFWLIRPTHSPLHIDFSFFDVAALAGVGGLTLAASIWWLKDRPLVPAGDPRLPESIRFFTS